MNLPFSNEVLYPRGPVPGVVHRISNVYRHRDGEEFLLTIVDIDLVSLVCLEDGTCWDSPTAIEDPWALTAEEWLDLASDPSDWEYLGRLRRFQVVRGYAIEKE